MVLWYLQWFRVFGITEILVAHFIHWCQLIIIRCMIFIMCFLFRFFRFLHEVLYTFCIFVCFMLTYMYCPCWVMYCRNRFHFVIMYQYICIYTNLHKELFLNIACLRFLKKKYAIRLPAFKLNYILIHLYLLLENRPTLYNHKINE